MELADVVDVVSHRFQGQVFVGGLAADPVGLLHPGIQASRHPGIQKEGYFRL